MSTAQSVNSTQVRVQFFDYLFGTQKGFLCVSTASNSKVDFKDNFFEWPGQRNILANFIEENQRNKNVWFCVNLLSQPKRRKEYCLPSSIVWADLDYIVPTEQTDPYPTCIIESSPARFQGYWRIDGAPVPPDVAEDFSKRIAYSLGADKSGWDLTQLLRVPWTNNLKYDPPAPVKLISISEDAYPLETFDRIPVVNPAENGNVLLQEELPIELPAVDNVLYRYRAEGRLDDDFFSMYTRQPESTVDWSRLLWRFIQKCFTVGMTPEEVLAVSDAAACNKYKRDNRPVSHLWHDVLKAAQEQRKHELFLQEKVEILTMPHLVDFDEFVEDTFIRDYKQWANQATDAPEQYHELTCFITLSAIVCSGLWLAVEWGEIVPNIWGLVLGESTLTRKTTAMRLSMDMLKDIDDSLILATDGSAEGLLTGLSHRPKRVSIFLKDEVSGLFDSINRKDYLAGLPETLTQLYDVPKILTRLLRKETITISEPYFIFFGGGIRDKVYSLINDEYILSGFLPRFLVVSGENDLTRLRRTGPPTELSSERKDNLIRSLSDLRDRYNTTVQSEILGQKVEWPVRIEARLTSDAWAFYGEIEEKLTNAGAASDLSMLALPTFTRMGFSCLKMSILVAASRREPDSSNRLTVEVGDVKQAAFYIERWGHYSVDMILNAGKSHTEKLISRALNLVKKKEGIAKSEVMQRMHLSARDAKDLIDTMVQRGLIDVKPAGRGVRLYSSIL